MRFIVLIVCFTLLWAGCKKKGCTNPNADNYEEEAKEDDGSCDFTSVESIIDVPWYRITDSTLYSFKLDPDGSWLTKKNCEIITEGSWEIDYETSTLSRYFNGVEETYSIIEPSPTKVKFRGISNGSSEISADNSLIVYENDYTISDYTSISEGVKFSEKWSSIEIENEIGLVELSDLDLLSLDGNRIIDGLDTTYCNARKSDWNSIEIASDAGYYFIPFIDYTVEVDIQNNIENGFTVTPTVIWDGESVNQGYFKGKASWTIEIEEVNISY